MYGHPKTNGGDAREIALGMLVVKAFAEDCWLFREEVDRMFVADHTHEGLRPGCASVAWEGYDGDPWPVWWPGTAEGEAFSRKHNVLLEAINGCILAVIPLERG